MKNSDLISLLQSFPDDLNVEFYNKNTPFAVNHVVLTENSIKLTSNSMEEQLSEANIALRKSLKAVFMAIVIIGVIVAANPLLWNLSTWLIVFIVSVGTLAFSHSAFINYKKLKSIKTI